MHFPTHDDRSATHQLLGLRALNDRKFETNLDFAAVEEVQKIATA